MNQQDNNQPLGEEQKNNEEYATMASLLQEEGLGLDLPHAGEIKTGTIASISPGQIMVSIGAKSEGIIRGDEFELIPPEVFAELEPGEDIPVYIVTPEDSHGNVILSYVRAMEAETWEEANKTMKDNETASGNVVGYNRGGLLVSFKELRGFLPASLLAYSRRSLVSGNTPEERFGGFLGEDVDFQIIEVDQERRRLIFSEKAALNETRDTVRDQVIENLTVGDVCEGHVTSLADFGAFVNINGADGLVHISEISWDRIRHPSEILKIGEEVKVKVISIDEEKRHIGLSIRRLQDDPWQESIDDLHVGQLVEAKITRLTKFGAFALLENGVEGLIHISEIADEHIEHPKEVLHEEDDVTLRIIKIEPESHRIGLSLRRVESLAFADMDMKELEKELIETNMKVTSDDAKEEIKESAPIEGASENSEESDKTSEQTEETVEEPIEEKPAEVETTEESKHEEKDDSLEQEG